LMVASWMAKSWTVLLYLPAMSIVGIFAGIAVGVAANYALAHIKVLQYFSKK
jgi:trans-hexaprenyltranstransferase subunit I